MTTTGRLLLFATCSASMLHAGSVSVAIDVSGSMRGYGPWQTDVRDLIANVLHGKAADQTRFSSIGDLSLVEGFKIGPDDVIHYVEFGSAQKPEFPFFGTIKQFGSVAEFAQAFPIQRDSYSQPNTNRDLARAVAAQLIGPPAAQVIMVSDFLVDARLDQAEQRYVNEFESKAKWKRHLSSNGPSIRKSK